MIKFNDPSGDSDQQQCHNTCGIVDQTTGEEGRLSDIHYIVDPEDSNVFHIQIGYGKCRTCPYLKNHLGIS